MKTIERPIFVLGVPHSGNSWLAKSIARHPHIAHSSETNFIWMWGNARKRDDVLTENDLTPKIRDHIQKRLIEHLTQSDGERLCDKTPRNCLRIPFLYELFPDAKIVFVIRDGRSVVSSIQSRSIKPTNKVLLNEISNRIGRVSITEAYLYFPKFLEILRRAFGKPLNYWGVRPPGWQDWVKSYPTPVVLSKQWSETIKLATYAGRKLPNSNYLEVKYETLACHPREEMTKIMSFLEIDEPDCVINYAESIADPTRIHNWKSRLTEADLSQIKEIIQPVMDEMGYSW